MNRSVDELFGAPHFPLRIATSEDGKIVVTCDSTPNKQWEGDTEEAAIRHARQDLTTLFVKDGLVQKPKWASEFEGAKPMDHDWLKD